MKKMKMRWEWNTDVGRLQKISYNESGDALDNLDAYGNEATELEGGRDLSLSRSGSLFRTNPLLQSTEGKRSS